jgi:dTDP-glucose pyrophosphorylase
MKPGWEQALIGPDATYRDALEAIDVTGMGMAIFVGSDRKLLGVLSDGDVRRALIRGAVLQEHALPGATRDPVCINQVHNRAEALEIFRKHGVRQLPVVDGEGQVTGLSTLSDFLDKPDRDNPVVIMAGGKGLRLKDLTRDTPKPMLKVGPKPMLDTIISRLSGQGFRKFWLAVNYRADQIERHFGDGSHLGIDISYLREQQPLGTCGALSLLPPQHRPVIVINGDVLTQIDFGQVLECHCRAGAIGTVMVRDHQVQVPFGVITANEDNVLRIEEKPTHTYMISAGAYVLSPEALAMIPTDSAFDMPSLLTLMLEAGLPVRHQLAEGYWMDIGQPFDYAQANMDFGTLFKG